MPEVYVDTLCSLHEIHSAIKCEVFVKLRHEEYIEFIGTRSAQEHAALKKR